MIEHTFVPGTDDKIFRPEDKPALRELPNDGSLTVFLDTFNGLSQIDVDDAAKKSEETQSS